MFCHPLTKKAFLLLMRLLEQDAHRLVGMLLLAASLPLLLWQAIPANQVAISAPTFLAVHSMMEIFAIVVAALVFFTGHGAQETVRSIRSITLGYAFLAVALFDILHSQLELLLQTLGDLSVGCTPPQ